MAKEVVTLMSSDEVILMLAQNLVKDISQLQTAIIKENKHDIGEHIKTAASRSLELYLRLEENKHG